MKPEMLTLKVGDATIKLPASTVAQFALAAVIGQVVPTAAPPTVTAPPFPGNVPPLGSYWPGQGGVNAGMVRAWGGGRDYFLIVPTGDKDEFEEVEYGPTGSEVSGADSTWDGKANTAALLASGKDYPAAKACAGFTADGHNDFYLPARRELQVCEANVTDLFKKEWYWSSTQRSAYGAYSMYFGGGGQNCYGKSYELRARPVRRLFI
jgi:hypothetical protein